VTIRVLVADDQPLMRAAFHMTLEPEDDIELIGEAANGVEAIEVTGRLKPDVVLMDIRMPLMDGVEATRIIAGAHPATRILILTTFDLDEYIVEALRAGASGFLLKDVGPDELVGAIRLVARGDALLSPSVTRRLLDAFAGKVPASDAWRPSGLAALTDREVEILTLVAKGHANQEIAGQLFVAETTVRTHIRHILEKLDLRDRVQAVVLAYDCGLVRPTPR
jgi:DNA-binding NarL/FixJ family response regulator